MDENESFRQVRAALRRVATWMKDSVVGFPDIETDDFRSFAMCIDYFLHEGGCGCGLKHCQSQHRFPREPMDEERHRQFVNTAVIGPFGLRVGSITQGMAFPFLRDGANIGQVPVRFHCCSNPSCGQAYEGGRCVKCGLPFDEETTEVIGKPWMVVRGIYLPVRHWGCGQEGKKHYYRQQNCIEPWVEGSFRVIHGKEHDRCPWQGCGSENPPHTPRGKGTTLWMRAEWVGPQPDPPPPGPGLEEALIMGASLVLQSLGPEGRARIGVTIEDPPSIRMVEEIFDHIKRLTLTEREEARKIFVETLEGYGWDEEHLWQWFDRSGRRPEEWEVTSDERSDDI